jgi:spermidine synthase
MDGSDPGSVKRWRILFLLFFLSGLSGLIYESIWSRYIRLFVGSAATAQILVLSLFMGGMSIGALVAGRHIRRLRKPIVAYGIIEGIIGLYALAFPWVQGVATRWAYDVLFPALGGGAAVGFAKWGLAAALILPPCVLLGTTFPLMSVGILRRDLKNSGAILSFLYFTNSFGASIGALLAGFALVGTLGLPGSLAVAGALNLFIMVVAIRDRTPSAPIEAREPPRAGASGLSARGYVWLYLAVALGTGLSSFMYEIGWIRLLSMILGSATHSFEVMLSAFVLGLALGGLWVRKRMDKFRRPELVLAIVQLIMGFSAVATLPAYRIAVEAMGFAMSSDEPRTLMMWYGFNLLRYLLCLLIMLPATFCAGMTLPLLTHVMLKRGQPESAVGNVYGVNTLGAIAGAVLAGLVLLPIVGLKGVIVIGALVDMILGLVLIRSEIRLGRGTADTPRLLNRAAVGTVFVTVFGLVVQVDPMVLTATVFRHGRTRLPDAYEILSYVDGRTASVTVVDNKHHDSYHIIYTNGKPDASVILNRWPEDRDPLDGPDIAGDEPNQFLVGLIPLMAKPEAKQGALIGFGSGVTCHTVLGSPVLERLDTIEIEPEMVRGSRFFMPVNWRAYQDPRSHIFYDDAKAYFASAGLKYDFIISEPTNPWVSGVSSLFTVEFYQEAKRYLAPGGVLAQWIQGYELSDELLISVLAAIDREFEDYLVVRIGSRDWVILSSPDGPIGQLSDVPLSWPDMHESWSLLGIHDVGQIDGLITANRAILHPYLADKTPNRDARPILDTGAERERFLRSSAEFLHAVRWTPGPILEVLGGIERRPYPLQGIGDYREPHILEETEGAMLLMRRYANPDERVPATMSAAPMSRWRDAARALPQSGDWETWVSRTYDVYRKTASHMPVHTMPWWAEVRRTVASAEHVPAEVEQSIELLDALSAKDGDRLWAVVEATLGEEDFPIPIALRTISGLVALELQNAPATRRQAFAREHMMGIGEGPTSQDYAYRALRAYALRP